MAVQFRPPPPRSPRSDRILASNEREEKETLAPFGVVVQWYDTGLLSHEISVRIRTIPLWVLSSKAEHPALTRQGQVRFLEDSPRSSRASLIIDNQTGLWVRYLPTSVDLNRGWKSAPSYARNGAGHSGVVPTWRRTPIRQGNVANLLLM